MKKLILAMFLVISFGLYGFSVSAAEPIDEVDPVIEEEVVEVEDTEDEVAPIEDEDTLEEIKMEIEEIIGLIFAYIGGFSGLGALVAFLFRYLKDKGILNKIKDELNKAIEKSNKTDENIDKMIAVVNEYSVREQRMEKVVINLLTLANIDPKLKTQLIKGLKDDSINSAEALKIALNHTKEEVEHKEQLINKIEENTQSLLEKLASKK